MKNNKTTKTSDYTCENDTSSVDSDKNRKKSVANGKRKASPKIDNASFLALLIRSFISFSLIIILGVVAIYAVAQWAFSENGINIRQKVVSDYEKELQSGNYSKIPTSRLLGKSGWLEIVTADGKTVYSTLDTSNEYTVGELDCIARYNKSERREVHNFKLEANKYNYLITISYRDSEGNKQERYYLLSKDDKAVYNIVSSSISTTKTSFTQKEYDYLTYNATHGDERLFRFSFKGADGVDYYAVYVDENINNNTMIYLFIVIVALGIVALFATVMVF